MFLHWPTATHNLPVTHISDNPMEMKSNPDTDDCRYFDPKTLGAMKAQFQDKRPFQEAFVSVVGGGNCTEYGNLA